MGDPQELELELEFLSSIKSPEDWIMEDLNRNKVGYNAWRNKTIDYLKPELMEAKEEIAKLPTKGLMGGNVLEAIKWIEVIKRWKPRTS